MQLKPAEQAKQAEQMEQEEQTAQTAQIIQIVQASPENGAACSEIYKPFVENTSVTFEYTPPDAEEFARRIASLQGKFPWLLCKKQGEVLGYVYASAHHPRAAFQWDVEVSAYFSPKAQGMGLGTAMYRLLFRLLREMGYLRVYALITVPNPQSRAFHQSVGFSQICLYPKTGFKLGEWHDMIVMEKMLDPLPENPQPPKAYTPALLEQVLQEEGHLFSSLRL